MDILYDLGRDVMEESDWLVVKEKLRRLVS